MKSRKLNIYLNTLGKNPEYAALFSHANQLNQLAHMLATSAAIPKRLLAHCKIGPLCHNQLTLFAENASIASKLKHFVPSILKKLHKEGWKIISIQVRVQQPGPTDRATTLGVHDSSVEKPRISSAGIESLNRFARTLPDSQLKDSIQRLLKNQS